MVHLHDPSACFVVLCCHQVAVDSYAGQIESILFACLHHLWVEPVAAAYLSCGGDDGDSVAKDDGDAAAARAWAQTDGYYSSHTW